MVVTVAVEPCPEREEEVPVPVAIAAALQVEAVECPEEEEAALAAVALLQEEAWTADPLEAAAVHPASLAHFLVETQEEACLARHLVAAVVAPLLRCPTVALEEEVLAAVVPHLARHLRLPHPNQYSLLSLLRSHSHNRSLRRAAVEYPCRLSMTRATRGGVETSWARERQYNELGAL